MRPKLISALATVGLCLFAARTPGQVASAATSNIRIPLKLGVGFSDFRTSFGHGTVKGGTLWLDYLPNQVPRLLEGIGIEAEARDLSMNPSSTTPVSRIDEAQGGVIYSWNHLKDVHPYGKMLIGYGNVDRTMFGVKGHDSRTITVYGGGLEFRVLGNVRSRVDYEYQFWPDFWKNSTPAESLTPSGFTFSVAYDLSNLGSH
jgi:hypothetical protein